MVAAYLVHPLWEDMNDRSIASKQRAECVTFRTRFQCAAQSETKTSSAEILVVKRYKFAMLAGRERYKHPGFLPASRRLRIFPLRKP